jgi:predicted RNA binding protein YcfA (HicA-like mRNA interferase family)
MPRLPTIKPRDAERVLVRAGFFLHHTRGSHHYYKHLDKPGLVTVPIHGRDLKRGTLASIIRQAGMTADEFRALL